ncbi:MAG: exodeoxyribonuclease VII large subunit, partial [bacterium]
MDDVANAAQSPKVWTVSALVRMLKELVEQTFYPFWLEGEISNLTLHRSGHVYFTLKDSGSQIAGVFFRGA